jgi:MoxR-like ATPase
MTDLPSDGVAQGVNEEGSHPMAVTSTEGLEKFEDMVVRAAETTAIHIRAAKEGIGKIIFGQEKVVDRALVTLLSGGHALLVGVPGLAKTRRCSRNS